MARRGKKRAAPPPSEEEDKLQQGDVKLEPGIKAEPGTTDVKSVPGTTYVKPEPGIKPEPADEEQQRAGAYPLAAAAPADGSTEMERERAAIIARNRERLLALGIPSLRTQLEGSGGGGSGGGGKKAGGGKAAKKAKKGGDAAGRAPRSGQPAEEHPTRRSRRLQDAAEHPKVKPETAEERFGRELGLFVVDGECPRCGRTMEKGHKQHLEGCSGRAPRADRPARRDEALQGLSAEERQDRHKVLEARMKQLHLDGLVELGQEAAKFMVLGSKNNAYTISLNDTKHTCQCLDYRFRRHNCKHILLVLSQLGVEECPGEWRAAVEQRMDELLEQKREREAVATATRGPPRNKDAEVALRLL
ncbi:ring finger domain-containing [Micractinium conductrix]|uniref:Ring finger domain-containing n=1 Tax=Micractinium conductrix TaxID=554055 RepID=A0A2P6V1A4_9CHLO|nr:ring finger domain-containing [Micractinium conductrix]|eukprot:PSC67876.1 ring finger domain-containing [Micractinium conductrix]